MAVVIEASFRKVPININPAQIPIITNSSTKAIASSFFREIPPFMTFSDDLEGKAKPLGDLQKELEEIPRGNKEDEELSAQLKNEIREIEHFLKKSEEDVDELERKKEEQKALVKKHEPTIQKLEKEIEGIDGALSEDRKSLEGLNPSLQEKNNEIERKIDKVQALREKLNQVEVGDQAYKLLGLFKTAVTVMLATLGLLGGVLMRKPGAAIGGGSLLAGGLFSSVSLGIYFAKEAKNKICAAEEDLDEADRKHFSDWISSLLGLVRALPMFEAFSRVSRLRGVHEKLSNSIRLKVKDLDNIEQQKTEIEERIQKLEKSKKEKQPELDGVIEQTTQAEFDFKKLHEQQDPIVEKMEAEEDRIEAIQKELSLVLERVEARGKRLLEITEEQNRLVERIKNGLSGKDLLEARNNFQELKKLLEPLLRDIQTASLEMCVSASAEKKGVSERSKKVQDNLKEARAKIIEGAQYAKIKISELNVTYAEGVEKDYEKALNDCLRALEFLNAVDPASTPETLQFYEHCEELLALWADRYPQVAFVAPHNMS